MANNAFKIDTGIVVTGANGHFYTPTYFYSTANVSGNTGIAGILTVVGNSSLSNVAVSGTLLPNTVGVAIGNTTLTFDGWFRNIDTSNSILASANGVALGGASNRFNAWFGNTNVSHIITIGTTTLNSTFYTATANNANTVGGVTANGILVRLVS